MPETFAALIFAHVLADFVLQTRWMIENKHRHLVLGLHGLIVLATAWSCLGVPPVPGPALYIVALVTGSHVLIDAIKLGALGWSGGRTAAVQLRLFLLDQLAHIGVIGLLSVAFATSFATGFWSALLLPSGQSLLLAVYVGLAGFIVATRVGDLLMRLGMALVSSFDKRAGERVGHGAGAPGRENPQDDPRGGDGLAHAGALIGVLERTLVFVFVLLGQFNAIGFVIAAKSILRFQYASQPRRSELVIIGTLASFAFAIVVAELTRWALAHLGFSPGVHAGAAGLMEPC